MQLNNMDCTGRSNAAERDSELGDDMSHDDHSDDEMRDCDSVEGDNVARGGVCLNSSMTSSTGDISGRDHTSDMHISHHHQFPPNHPLNALNNFMGMGGLHGMPSLQHNDVLEKLKMQVRDMKVGLMDQEYAAAHVAAFGANVLQTPINTAFTLPPTTMASFSHAAQTLAAQTGNGKNTHLNANSTSGTSVAVTSSSNGSHNSNASFSFTSPSAPNTKDANPASNSSTSSEASNSSQHNNGWSFEEQYKQVRQLYEINDDPKRKEFLDDLFSFMQKRGTPINRLPIMAKSVLDLYELYNLVIARGGLVDVINKKLWQEIIKGLHLPSSITSAAFTLRTQYMKYLYPYECEKKNLSTPGELQAAIDGNRREGRRSSYGQYEAIHNQIQMPAIARQGMPGGLQQMSPLALVTHAAAANNQQAQAAAAAAAAHHRLMAPTFGQMPNLVSQEIEQRMIEYLKLIQVKKEQNVLANSTNAMGLSPHHQHQQQQHQQAQQHRQRSQSPEISPREALNALEMSRVALWQMYHNNTSPPASVNASPQGNSVTGVASGGNASSGSETQRSEAQNLSDSPPSVAAIKRERELESGQEVIESSDFHNQPPPAKRVGFPTSFYIPPGISTMAAAAAAVNFHYKDKEEQHESDGEEDHDAEDGHNTTANSSHDDPADCHQLNGVNVRQSHHDSDSSVHIDKSDDSAIENSPSTSAVSASNGHASPVSTKKIHLSKQHYVQLQPNNAKGSDSIASPMSTDNSPLGALEALNLLSGMQFRVTRHGTNSNGEQQLSVNLELNGVRYSGVLIANNCSRKTVEPVANDNDVSNTCRNDMSSMPSHPNEENLIGFCPRSENSITSTVPHCNDEQKDVEDASDVMSVIRESAACDTDTRSIVNTASANGPIPTNLKDTLITS